MAWLALPDLNVGGKVRHANRKLMVAMCIDAGGNGTFLPFALVFYRLVTRLGIARIGLALTIAGIVALPVGPLVGRLTKRHNVFGFLVAGNLMQGAAFALYLLVHSFWTLTVVASLSTISGEGFWTASSVFVARAAEGAAISAWYSVQRVARNLGLGAGSLTVGLALSVVPNRHGVFVVVVVANSASFFVAAALLESWRRGEGLRAADFHVARGGEPAGRHSRPAGVWADRTFCRLVAVTFVATLGGLVAPLLWAIFIEDHLHMAGSVVGGMFALNCGLVVLLQVPFTRRFGGSRASRQLATALSLWAGMFAALAALVVAPRVVLAPALLAIAVVYTLAEMSLGPAMSTAQVASANPVAVGDYLGAYQATRTLTSVAAPVLLTGLLATAVALPWVTLAVLAAAGALLALGAPGEERPEPGGGE